MNCPLCQHSSKQIFQKDDYWIRECTNCNHRFVELDMDAQHVETVYGDDYFFEGGAGYDNYLSEADLLIEHGERYGKILEQFTSQGTVLDIGSAAGYILKGLTNTGWQGDGIEPNATMAQHARDVVGVNVSTSALEHYEPAHQYDLVTMVQVVAHFYDVQKAFEVATRAVKPNGLLLIETWNRASLPARLLGSNWHEYSPPSVVHWFSDDGLKEHVERFGFEEIARGQPEKWLKSDHAKSLLKYKLQTIPVIKLAAPLVNIVPDNLRIPYPSYDLFWGLYRNGLTN